MNIAIDISPLSSGHKVRGTGFYLKYLKEALQKYYPDNTYTFFGKSEKIDLNTDIVHYPYFDPFLQTLPFFNKYKTVVTVHDLTPLVFPSHFPSGIKGKFNWHLQKFKLQHVNGIVTDSFASQKDIVQIAGIDTSKVDVAYLAAGDEFKKYDLSRNNNKLLRGKYKLPEKFILYVGDVTWNKNLPLLLKSSIQASIPLVLVGKALVSTEYDRQNVWNNDLIEVQSLIEQNTNVLSLGFVPTNELVALYNLATVFVFPSIYEGFGLPIVEAMQAGTPTIISKESCMPEVGGDAVEYFDGYSSQSLSEAISKVFNSEKIQKDLSKKGIEQAKKFSWKKTAEKTIEAYKKVLVQ